MKRKELVECLIALGPVETIGVALTCGARIYGETEDRTKVPLDGAQIVRAIIDSYEKLGRPQRRQVDAMLRKALKEKNTDEPATKN